MLRTRSLIRITAALLLAGCQEKLASPAECPELCPGGYNVYEDTLFALPNGDSAYVGYLEPGQGSSLRVSHQFAVSEDRAAFRFARRTDSLTVGGILKPYTLDSIALEISLGYRDSTVHGLKVFLYRLPATLDSSFTYADIDGAFSPATVVDSFMVDDSVVSKRLRVVLIGNDTTKLSIPAADSAVLALGVQIRADQGTGIRIGGAAAGSSAPSFINYVALAGTDTGTVHAVVTPGIQFNTFVSQTPQTIDPDRLTIGGAPSARALIRFPWPDRLRDSATLVRATLQMLPAVPVDGLRADTAFVLARPIIADFGGKSPAVTDAAFTTAVPVLPGSTDTVSIEVRTQLSSWQGSNPVPPAISLQLSPEVSSFTRVILGSSRTPGLVPRIIVSYALKFPFGAP